jgi:trigger factor
MQIVETTNEGLKRSYSVKIAAKDIAARIDGEVAKIAPDVRMAGFRPGKVPANLVKKMHGPQLHQEALNTTVREAVDKVIGDHQLRPAMQPQIALGDGYEQGKDAELTVELEVLPTIPAPQIDALKLDKLVVPVSDAEVAEQVAKLAANAKAFIDAKKGKKAETGDQLIIDFLGKVDGVPFDGGKAEDAALEIGSGRFIPGFEEQLIGCKEGDEKTITVTFPADYQAAELKGKDATFDVKVKSVKVPGETKIDDDFAKSLGLTSLEQLQGLLRGQLEQETAGQTRTQMKRALLDLLAAGHSFDVPPTMVEAEFEQIWAQLNQEAQQEEDPAAALTEIEAEKDDYRAIAVRRVRLGLLLSEIGQANGVEVSAQEMNMLVQQAAQQYRAEDRQRFMEYIQQDALAAAQLRAPLYEDKVVDFLFDKAEVTEKTVTKDELQAAIEAEDAAPVPVKPAKKGPAKTAAANADEKVEAKPKVKPAKETKTAAPKKEAAPTAEKPAAEKPAAAKKAPAKKAAPKK